MGKPRGRNREHMSQRGQRTSFNGAEGISDIEGKATRVGASEGGQRTSFNCFAPYRVFCSLRKLKRRKNNNPMEQLQTSLLLTAALSLAAASVYAQAA